MPIEVIISNKCQGMLDLSLNKNPKSEFKVIIASEVAIAFSMGIFSKIVRAGTIKNPPPAPTKPVTPPTKIPLVKIFFGLGFFCGS